ncbi:hypothetical protein E8E12_011596 [Didymella heteroderae]|uniref:DUF4246 domain-containing protein n=1 Tax=Didymella heteroderae TaxID=1769908 RepID=A0A9P4WZB9_9PLEO|nr:hypothetical protein E8E12_011596 [Didymella heteroderae]
MDALTDKPDWHIQVNDESICIQELRNKAKFFEKSGKVPTLYAHAVVVKSDTLVSDLLHESLLAAFARLKTDQADSPDWHPNSGDRVQNLVHQSLFPLVYNRSRAVREDVVGVEDAIDKWLGRGEVVVGEQPWIPQGSERFSYGVGRPIPPDFWSVNFQWLPSNVTFQDNGTVRFTSYINNLHPKKYPKIYRAIERLIETSLPIDENALNWNPPDLELCAKVDVDAQTLEDYGWADEEEYADENERKKWLTEAKWMACESRSSHAPLSRIWIMTQYKHITSQHRVSPFELADPTKPGRRRFIALWLVDPHKRIISTANVPPQQLSWWAESLVSKDTASTDTGFRGTTLPPEIVSLLQEYGAQIPVSSIRGKLPEDILEMIRERLPKEALPMPLDEAKKHRLKLMEERGVHQVRSEDAWQQHSYGFCEH